MKKKTQLLIILTLLLAVFAYIIIIYVHDLDFAYSEGKLGSGYTFRFLIKGWELISIAVLLGSLIFVIIRKPKNS